MNNVVRLYPNQDVVATLRKIADQIESGEVEADHLTIATSNYDLFQLGSINDDIAAKDAIFNMTMAINKIGSYVYEHFYDDEEEAP